MHFKKAGVMSNNFDNFNKSKKDFSRRNFLGFGASLALCGAAFSSLAFGADSIESNTAQNNTNPQNNATNATPTNKQEQEKPSKNILQTPQIKLNNGIYMPQIGFDLAGVVGGNGYDVIHNALSAGFRFFDTAAQYENERLLGQIINQQIEGGHSRDEFFISTKLPRTGDVASELDSSLKYLGLDFIDLYTIQFPSDSGYNLRAMRVLENAFKSKKIRAIGLSGFNVSQLRAVLATSELRPAVVFSQAHPFFVDLELVKLCKAQNIALCATSPLAKWSISEKNGILRTAAQEHQKTIAQIMLRYSVQCGFVPLARAADEISAKEYIDIFDFELNSEQMTQISALNTPSGKI